MIHGIKLKIKAQREILKVEENKQGKKRNPEKIKSLKRSIRGKNTEIRNLKTKQSKKK